jgi:hypothetical protein
MGNGSSTGFISLNKAIEMTSRYRQNKNTVIDPAFSGNGILAISDTFNKAAIEALLAKPGCTAIRLYYGMDAGLQLRPILVAVGLNNEDILPVNMGNNDAVGTDIVDDTIKCPPICPPPSALNQ